MSKERARRREEREAQATKERERRAAARRRAESRAQVSGAVTAPVSRSRRSLGRWWRRRYPQNDPFARRRLRRTLILAAIFFGTQAVAWWLTPVWSNRLLVLMVSVLVLPVVRVMIFDRR